MLIEDNFLSTEKKKEEKVKIEIIYSSETNHLVLVYVFPIFVFYV